MPIQQINAKDVKEKILKFLRERGPCLPVHVAKHIELNSIFTSAFLSELASEGAIRISDMKVGGSPLYFTPDKIDLLENFVNHLGPKEREACLLLKSNGILQDAAQTPVIRVALRSLKDFAVPIKKEGKIIWEYFTFKGKLEDPEQQKPKQEIAELKAEEPVTQVAKEQDKIPEPIKDDELKKVKEELEEKKKELENIMHELQKDKEQDKKMKSEKPKKAKKKAGLIKKTKLIDEKFLKEVKAILKEREIELLDIAHFDKKQVFARVLVGDKEQLLAAFDKKKVEDSDLIKAHKRASSLNLPYTLLSRGELSRKTKEAIEAYKNLTSIEKIGPPKDSPKQ